MPVNTCSTRISIAKISKFTDDHLCEELMDWVRIGRNEGNLYGDEREYLKEVCKEIRKRKLLKVNNLYYDKG